MHVEVPFNAIAHARLPRPQTLVPVVTHAEAQSSATALVLLLHLPITGSPATLVEEPFSAMAHVAPSVLRAEIPVSRVALAVARLAVA